MLEVFKRLLISLKALLWVGTITLIAMAFHNSGGLIDLKLLALFLLPAIAGHIGLNIYFQKFINYENFWVRLTLLAKGAIWGGFVVFLMVFEVGSYRGISEEDAIFATLLLLVIHVIFNWIIRPVVKDKSVFSKLTNR